MEKHTITASRRRSAPVTRRRQTRTPTRRQHTSLIAYERWLVFWHLRRGIVRPRLATLSIGLIWSLVLWLGLAHLVHVWPAAQAAPAPAATSARPTPTPVSSAAQRVPALYQGDPGLGWDSPQQYQTWWPSACSAVSLTADLRGLGVHVGVGAVLDRLWNLGAISAEQGLLHAEALGTVAQQYGYQAKTFWHWSAQEVAQTTNQGVPVLVLLDAAEQQTPYPGFVVGHWLVVTRVSSDQIAVRDSSGYHIQTLTPPLFQTLFTGVAVVIWHGTLSLP